MLEKTTDSTFEDDVLKSEVPVLVEFWAPWCGPSRLFGPVIEKIAEEVEGEAKVFKLNIDENPATAAKYGIPGIPTTLIFKNGKVAEKFLGVQTKEVCKDALGVYE